MPHIEENTQTDIIHIHIDQTTQYNLQLSNKVFSNKVFLKIKSLKKKKKKIYSYINSINISKRTNINITTRNFFSIGCRIILN